MQKELAVGGGAICSPDADSYDMARTQGTTQKDCGCKKNEIALHCN